VAHGPRAVRRAGFSLLLPNFFPDLVVAGVGGPAVFLFYLLQIAGALI
jgi:hypothetical protein